MRVLFLQPPFGAWSTYGKHTANNVNHVQLAGCLREWTPDIEIKALDCRALDIDKGQMVEKIAEIKPNLIYMGDLLQTTGVAAISTHYRQAAELIKKRCPETNICVGGFYHSVIAPQVLSETPYFDFVICGETEVTFTDLAKELTKKEPDIPSVKGLAYREDGNVRLTDYRPLLDDLNQLPMPAYDLFPMKKYVGFSYIKNYVETYNSRGCPNGCAFCVGWSLFDDRGNNDWKRYRFRSGKKVAEELAILHQNYKVRFVVMLDDTFNVYRKRVEEFIEEKRRLDLKDMKYLIMGRAPYFLRDMDLLKNLRNSGCIGALVGLEATDDPTLKKIEKRITVDQVQEVVAKFREVGILSVVTWMIGFPDDDERMIKERFAKLDRIDPDMTALQMLTPLPGIPLRKEVEPLIEDWDLSKWDFHHPVVRTKYLSREDLGRLAAWTYREFYSRPGRIQRILFDKRYHPFMRLCARNYVETVNAFSQAAEEGKQFI